MAFENQKYLGCPYKPLYAALRAELSQIIQKGLRCYVCLLMRTVNRLISVFFKSFFSPINTILVYINFSKKYLWNFCINKLLQRRHPSKQGCCPPVQSPRWSPWPPWPRIYMILRHFLKERQLLAQEQGIFVCLKLLLSVEINETSSPFNRSET